MLRVERLEPRTLPSGLVPVGSQPVGGLTGKIAYLHAGHGFTANNAGSGAWSFQRGETFEMIEDLGNIDQMNFLADTLFRAGATIVPLRPIGNQRNEVVLDNDDPGVTFNGTWSNSSSTIYFGSAGDVPYRFANTSPTETAYARYRPTIPAAGFYPIYCWTRSGSDRATDSLYRVAHAGGITEVKVNHRRVGNGLVYLGTYYFESGTAGYVDISNRSSSTGSVVIADMIRFGNGMGSIDRGGGVSGRPREDEAGLYWIQWHVDRSQGVATSEYRTASDDRDATVGASPRYAEYMNREQDGSLSDRVFVSYHSNAAGGRGVDGLHNTQWGSSATPNQFELANLLGLEINADLVAQNGQYENNWFDNGTNVTFQHPDYPFGEINNSVINNEFDATIVEVAFHDNQLDAELMRDARVRDAVARATYQGLVKYFRSVDGNTTSAVQLPGGVTNVRGTSNAIGSVTLNWTAPGVSGVLGDAATGYRVYASTNGYAFDGGTLVNGTTATLMGYDPSLPYYFKVAAVNAGGEGPASEVMAVRPSGGTKRVLIVNGFDRLDRSLNPTESAGGGTIERVKPRQSNSRDYTVQVGAALQSARPGLRFDSTSNEAVISGDVNLTDYAAVIWISGEESTADDTFNTTEQAKVEAFIAAGGHFLVSGAEIGWDLDAQGNGVSFFETTLKGNYVNDDANSYSLTGTAAGIFNGLSFSFDNGTLFYNAEYPDVINPQAGATSALTYSTGGSGAIQAPGTAGRGSVLLMGFPFETITTAANRSAVMNRVMTFFGITPDTTGPVVSAISTTASNGTYATGQVIPITLAFSEPVSLSGTLNVTLDSGAVLAIPSFDGSSVVVNATIAAGQTSPDLTVVSLALSGTLKDFAGNAASLTLPTNNLGTNANLLVNPLPPGTVQTVVVNNGEAQRSRVTSVTLNFATAIDAAKLSVITLTNGVSSLSVGNGISVAPQFGMVTSATLTFTNVAGVEHGSLADGRWTLSIPWLSLTSTFHRLFGDVNGDGTVDGGSDFSQFRFETASSPFDWNNDGAVDGGTDFAQFGSRFGKTV